MLSLIWHKNLTLNPLSKGEVLASSYIGEGVGDDAKLSQFTINIILLLIFFFLEFSLSIAPSQTCAPTYAGKRNCY